MIIQLLELSPIAQDLHLTPPFRPLHKAVLICRELRECACIWDSPPIYSSSCCWGRKTGEKLHTFASLGFGSPSLAGLLHPRPLMFHMYDSTYISTGLFPLTWTAMLHSWFYVSRHIWWAGQQFSTSSPCCLQMKSHSAGLREVGPQRFRLQHCDQPAIFPAAWVADAGAQCALAGEGSECPSPAPWSRAAGRPQAGGLHRVGG